MNPSILITPNSGEAGKLFSIIPTNGAGDLDVVRATSATRVDENGLIEIPTTNLLLRSEEFDNASWTKTAGVVVTANSEISPNGTMTADTINFGAINRFVSQGTSLSTGVIVSGSIYVKGISGQTIQIAVGGVDVLFTLNGNWQRLKSTRTSVTNSFNLNTFGGATARIISVWGAQLEQGSTATEYIPTTSVVRTRFAGITQDGSSASNIPRFDYTNGSCPSILVEPQRTNLLLRSEEFENVAWGKSGVTVSPNLIISPDGTQNADKIIETASSGSHQFWEIKGIAGINTVSFYAKAGERNSIQLEQESGGNSRFILSGSGTATALGANSVSIELIGNGWYKCTSTFTASGAFGCYFKLYNGSTSYTGDGGSGIYFWGAQLEAGANATSYIPTVASAVTRNADIISNSNLISKGLIVNDYTLVLDITNPVLGSQYILDSIDISFNRTGILRVERTSASVTDIAGGSSLTITNALTIGKGKMCLKRTGNVLSFFTNGIKSASTTTTTAGTINTLSTGVLNSTTGSYVNSIVLFPLALTDEQCISLTQL